MSIAQIAEPMNMQHNRHLNLREILIGSAALCFAYATL